MNRPNKSNMVVVRQMKTDELSRAVEIDVSEGGDIVFKYIDGEILPERVVWHRPRWTAEEWKQTLDRWARKLKWDIMLGAFDGDQLVGMASLRYRLKGDTALLVSLHVSREFRRRGFASQLTQEIIRLARESGARQLYVSATPSESAIGFYGSQGFYPTEQVDRELFELEPEDIHMIRAL